MEGFLQNATGLIDASLARYSKRDLVSAAEVTDLLLDVRCMIVEAVGAVEHNTVVPVS